MAHCKGRPSVGRLNLFGYNPKLRAKLPYYDIFPLVLPLEPISGGFMGMNFHYLPPLLRSKLLERMQARASDRRFNKNTRFEVNYDDVNDQTCKTNNQKIFVCICSNRIFKNKC